MRAATIFCVVAILVGLFIGKFGHRNKHFTFSRLIEIHFRTDNVDITQELTHKEESLLPTSPELSLAFSMVFSAASSPVPFLLETFQ